MIGAGKYDVECTLARHATRAAGAMLLVFAGLRGHGFSIQAPKEVIVLLPELLREVAAQIEADIKEQGLVKEGRL